MILKIGLGVGLAIVAFTIFGFWRLRQSIKQAEQEIAMTKCEEIPFLAEECLRTFKKKFQVQLDLNRFDESAEIVDSYIKQDRIKKAFARDDFYWYFVKPVGAFIGELIRKHADAQWHESDGNGPSLTIRASEIEAATHPFAKVIKHVVHGDAGDLFAYLQIAKEGFPNASGYLDSGGNGDSENNSPSNPMR